MSDDTQPAAAMTHKITYGGTWRSGYWWRCTCGASMGTGRGNSDPEDGFPFEYPFDRTYWAHEHIEKKVQR